MRDGNENGKRFCHLVDESEGGVHTGKRNRSIIARHADQSPREKKFLAPA